MRMRTATAALCALGAIVAATVSTGAPATAGTSTDLRVGTFNIVTVSADPGASGDRHVWKERRGTIIGQILGQGLDVVGIQEANQSTLYKSRLVGGSTQFLDLRNGLNAAGGHYALTSTASYNCLRAWSSNHCKYRNRAASGDNRILYNHDKLALIYKGAYRYPHQVPGKTARYLAWTVLRDRATGKEFLFTTTHLDPYSIPVRIQQWHDMIAKVNKLKGSRPVIVTGDFNTSKYSPYAATMLPAMTERRVRRHARPALPHEPHRAAGAEHPARVGELVQRLPPGRRRLRRRPLRRPRRAPATASTGSSRPTRCRSGSSRSSPRWTRARCSSAARSRRTTT